ncbi:MAG TPA: hypothetical protein VFK85_14530 [Anaeromyxobacteraceae bacterium]|nr:hypothetical protein [Anaeromyxobacteraceae bacterium]
MDETAARRAPRSGLELRVERERAVVRFPRESLAAGITVAELALEVPKPGAHLDVGAGPSQFRHRLCDLDTLDLDVTREGLNALRDRALLDAAGFADAEVALGPDLVELGATVDGGRFTCRLALVPGEDEGCRVAVLDARVHTAGGASAATLASRVATALGSGAADGVIAAISPVRRVLLGILPRRGFKLPRAGTARLATARATADGIRLGWTRWAAPAALPPDPELLATLDGIRAFASAEALLGGDEGAARKAWLELPAGARGHPFAAARLLSLLSVDPRCHGEARALARDWLARDAEFVPALLAQALIASAAGESAVAARAFSTLARLAQHRGQELAALAAADACAALGSGADPAALAQALDAALKVRRSHVPALRALHDLSRRTLDRAALLRACRGLAAHAPDALEKARAHARLAVLLAEADPAAARLHLANAQRLGPADAETRDATVRLGSG